MLDEGVATSLRKPEAGTPPGPPSAASARRPWVLLAAAPVVEFAATWLLDGAADALRCLAFGVPVAAWGAPAPLFAGVHASLVVVVAVAAAIVALVARAAPAGRRRATFAGLTAILVAPQTFGTVRDAVRWSRAAEARPVELVAACAPGSLAATTGGGGGRAIEWRSAQLVLNESRRVELSGARVRRVDDVAPPLVELRARDADAGDLARLSWWSVSAGGSCDRVALLVDGELRTVARVDAVLTRGRFAVSVEGESDARELYDAVARR